MDDEHLVTDAFVEVASSLVGGATGLLVAGPAGALCGAATAPAVRASVAEVVNRIRRRREERVEFVIQHAARLVNVSPRRADGGARERRQREQLLVRTLQAAQEETVIDHLVALAVSLATAKAGSFGENVVAFETAFARAIAQCDHAHTELLAAFTATSNNLGLGDGSTAFDSVPEGLNDVQLSNIQARRGLGERSSICSPPSSNLDLSAMWFPEAQLRQCCREQSRAGRSQTSGDSSSRASTSSATRSTRQQQRQTDDEE